MKKKDVFLWILAIISLVVVGFLVCMGTENRAITLEEEIENSSGAIRVQEKRRFDLIPNLVECVKDYNRHEYETMKEVIKSRGMNEASVEEVKVLLKAVSEAYPELKAVDNYKNLMSELALTENKISKMRDGFNQDVTDYKRYTRRFPIKQILSLRGYELKKYERLEFEKTSEDAPTISF